MTAEYIKRSRAAFNNALVRGRATLIALRSSSLTFKRETSREELRGVIRSIHFSVRNVSSHCVYFMRAWAKIYHLFFPTKISAKGISFYSCDLLIILISDALC